jgi:hypothetical protein
MQSKMGMQLLIRPARYLIGVAKIARATVQAEERYAAQRPGVRGETRHAHLLAKYLRREVRRRSFQPVHESVRG